MLFPEFTKDGPANLGDEFTYNGSANQPVILQGCVGFFCLILLLLILVIYFLMLCGWHLDKILVTWDFSLYKVGQDSIAYPLSSL